MVCATTNVSLVIQTLKICLHLLRRQKMFVVSYTCPGVSKALFECYSHNSITLPLPTRGNSYLSLKALGSQFRSYGPMISCTVSSKAKYKILGKLRRNQPLVVSVAFSFVQLHFIITSLPGKHSQFLWISQKFSLLSTFVKVCWPTGTGKDPALFNFLHQPQTNKSCNKSN